VCAENLKLMYHDYENEKARGEPGLIVKYLLTLANEGIEIEWTAFVCPILNTRNCELGHKPQTGIIRRSPRSSSQCRRNQQQSLHAVQYSVSLDQIWRFVAAGEPAIDR
jgi:hypothetical protein